MTEPPTPEEEDRRRLSRERKALVAERVEHTNRIKGLLFSQGIVRLRAAAPRSSPTARRIDDGRRATAAGQPQDRRSARELDRLELLLDQIKAVEAERDALLAEQQVDALPPAGNMLLEFKGVGPEFATVLWTEGLFRHFDNRRQVASYAGLAPTPWQSGSVSHEQGVSKAGNPRLADDADRTGMAVAQEPADFGAVAVVQTAG